MKKIIYGVVLTVICFFAVMPLTYAEVKPQKETLDDLKAIPAELNTLLTSVKTWSDDYKEELVDTLDKKLYDSIMLNIRARDFNKVVTLLVNSLNANGYSQAAVALGNMKQSIISTMDNSMVVLANTYDYVAYHCHGEDGCSATVIMPIATNINNLFKGIEVSLKSIVDTYATAYENDIKGIVSDFENLTLEEYARLVTKIDEKIEIQIDALMTIDNFVKRWEGYINSSQGLNLGDVYTTPIVQGMFEQYIETIEDYIDDIYTEMKTEYTSKLNVAKTTTDVKERKSLLYMLNSKMTILKSTFTGYSNLSKIAYLPAFKNFINNKLVTIKADIYDEIEAEISRGGNALETDLVVEPATGAKNVVISQTNKLIQLKSLDLNSSEVMKNFDVTYGDLEVEDYYTNSEGKILIGTNSVVNIVIDGILVDSFEVVVKGDISPSGEIDITDIVDLCDVLLKGTPIAGNREKAADMDDNETLDITDVVNLCDMVLKGV